MDLVIIEDEMQTALDIQHTLSAIRPNINVMAILDSVEQAVYWFSGNERPDLIISDIQLGDGLTFSIFKKVEIICPVIFCTAYNEYALEAFESNGIDYILKPFNETTLDRSIAKVEMISRSFSSRIDMHKLETLIRRMYLNGIRYRSRFLVCFRNKLIPIQADEIAFMKVDCDLTYIFTRHGHKYSISKSLDALEAQLDPNTFYRANRQYIISYNAVRQVEYYQERKLLLRLKDFEAEEIIISKVKATSFVRWLEER